MRVPPQRSSANDASTGTGTSQNACDELGVRVAALEGKLRRDGWEAVATVAPKTGVVVRDDGNELWLVHEAPADQISAVVKAFQGDGFISTCTYQHRRDGRLCELLLLLNPGSKHAILLPTIVETEKLPASTTVGDDETHLYSVVTRSTGERIGAVQHTTPTTVLTDTT
jgi:hypothetical protein